MFLSKNISQEKKGLILYTGEVTRFCKNSIYSFNICLGFNLEYVATCA